MQRAVGEHASPTRPSTISENFSAGPNLSATSASGGAATAITSVATHAGEERADRGGGERRPARPWRAIW